MTISAQKRREIIDALRRGTVPRQGLDQFAVGMERFVEAVDDELGSVKAGASQFKAVRGEYGCGKTFFSRWLQERAKKQGFAVAEVQISETETPLHRLETVYRRLMERLSTGDSQEGAFRSVIDGWFYTLEEDLIASGKATPSNESALLEESNLLMEQRLQSVAKQAPAFAAGLRGYRRAMAAGQPSIAEGLLAWVAGQPNVGAEIKRFAAIKGEIDHFAALNFLQGLLVILRDSGHKGLVICMDEVETLQRMRGDVRDKGLNALRQLIDEVDTGRFPGLYILITGTPAFFDGPQGVQRLPPVAQRLHVDFKTDERFDNPRAVQVRLKGFDLTSLTELGCRIRNIYCEHSENAQRIGKLANDNYIRQLATAVTGRLGGKIGIAPRIFLKKLVGEVLDRIDQFPDFSPTRDYELTLTETEMTATERAASTANCVDDIEIKV
jgi:hypothetical protein